MKAVNITQLQEEILRLKKEKDVCILAHSYQAREICEIADFTGDMSGVQIGVVNIVRRVKGLQIGVVNWTETMECGLQIGLWNQIKNNGWVTVLPIVNGHF